MKHSVLIILLLALAFGAFSNLNAQVTVTLGEGTDVNSETGAPTPYGTYFKNFH
nr:hypothetical protein [Candidatus Cloacimonadota bacterium]